MLKWGITKETGTSEIFNYTDFSYLISEFSHTSLKEVINTWSFKEWGNWYQHASEHIWKCCFYKYVQIATCSRWLYNGKLKNNMILQEQDPSGFQNTQFLTCKWTNSWVEDPKSFKSVFGLPLVSSQGHNQRFKSSWENTIVIRSLWCSKRIFTCII